MSTFNLNNLNNISISGNLTDCKTGKPLEGVEVLLVDAKGEVSKITSSNADGLFRFLAISMNQNYSVVVKGATMSLLENGDICVKNL